MSKHIWKTTSGFCPVINNEVNVELEYAEISVVNSHTEQYKVVSVECPYSDRCTENQCTIARENVVIEI